MNQSLARDIGNSSRENFSSHSLVIANAVAIKADRKSRFVTPKLTDRGESYNYKPVYVTIIRAQQQNICQRLIWFVCSFTHSTTPSQIYEKQGLRFVQQPLLDRMKQSVLLYKFHFSKQYQRVLRCYNLQKKHRASLQVAHASKQPSFFEVLNSPSFKLYHFLTTLL